MPWISKEKFQAGLKGQTADGVAFDETAEPDNLAPKPFYGQSMISPKVYKALWKTQQLKDAAQQMAFMDPKLGVPYDPNYAGQAFDPQALDERAGIMYLAHLAVEILKPRTWLLPRAEVERGFRNFLHLQKMDPPCPNVPKPAS